jgi:hypothetical protein
VHTAVLRRVDIWSLFKVAFVLYATLGLVAGLFYGLIFMVIGQLGGLLGDEEIPGLGFLTGIVGVLAVPVLALFYGVLGSIVVAIGGALYNLAARWVGGVRLELDGGESRPVTSAPPGPSSASTS